MATFDTQINSWVSDVQFRDASAAQLALYNTQLSAGTTPLTVQKNIIDEGATLAYTNPVVRMYQAAFGRIPDLGGQKGWVNQLQAGTNTIPSMGNWFADAPEFALMYNGANSKTAANKTLVDSFYINVLQRAPDAQGEAFWISSGLKAGQLLTAFSESAEFIGTSLPQAQGLQQLNIQSQYPTNVFISLFATPSYNQVINAGGDIVLTTAIETVPASGVLTANQKVSGVVTDNGITANTGSTFQSGDVINGGGAAAKNVLTITAAGTALGGDGATATVRNVNRIDVKNVGAPFVAVTFNEALYEGVAEQWLTAGVAGSITNLTNAIAASTYGVSTNTASTYNVGFVAGVTNQTFKVALVGAGLSAAANATVDYVQTAAANEINAISVDTTGNNFVTLNGTTNVRTVTVTGAGKNAFALTGAGALAVTGAVTIDASAATGDNLIDLGANLTTGTLTFKGATAAGTNTTFGALVAGALTLPTITNVNGLQLDLGSNGTIIAGTANTSIKTLTILDVTAAANADAYTLTGINGVSSVVWGTTGGGNNNGGLLNLTGTGTLAETFALQTNATLAAGNSLVIGAETLNGYTGVSFNTANGVGSSGTVNIGSVTGTALQTYSVTSASTGFHTLNTLTSTAAGVGTVTAIDLSNIAGGANLTVGVNTLGTAATISGAVGATTLLVGPGEVGNTSLSVTLKDANNNFTYVSTTASEVVNAGNGNNTITTGTLADVITVGNGANTISANAGTNIVTLGTGHAGAGNVDLINFNNNSLVTAGSDTINNFVGGAAADTLGVAAATNVLGIVNGGAVVLGNATATALNFGAGAVAPVTAAGNNKVFIQSNAAFNTTLTATSTLAQVASDFVDSVTGAQAGKFLLNVAGTGTFVLDATGATQDIVFEVHATLGVVDGAALIGVVNHGAAATAFANFV